MTRMLPLICAVAWQAFGQSPSPEEISGFFSAFQHTDTPGCAVGVEAPGREVWTGAYGMADLEHGVANTPNTVFEAGSVSKQFTAAAVLLLVERGQISLDDNIRKYFPEIPKYDQPITVRNLLNHTSGLRDWGEVEGIAGWPRGTREYTHANVLEIISRQHSLNYTPGTAWSYTNSGYNLAAMLVERVSGMTLQSFCRKEFFEPLGMTSTQWRDDFRRVVANRAIAYQVHEGMWRQDMPFEDAYGNGGLLTTVGDLLKWNENMVARKLHRAVLELMQKPGMLSDGHPIGYGFGLFLNKDHGFAEVSHSGATAGYRTWLGRIPAKGISVAVICNASSANAPELAHKIINAFLGGPVPDSPPAARDVKPGLYRNLRDHTTLAVEEGKALPVPPSAVRFDGGKMVVTDSVYGDEVWEVVDRWTPKDLTAFEGVYSSEEAETVLRVVVEKGRLTVHRRPHSSFPLDPTYKDAFRCSLGGIRFVRDAAGKIVSLSLSGSRVWDLRFVRDDSKAADAPK